MEKNISRRLFVGAVAAAPTALLAAGSIASPPSPVMAAVAASRAADARFDALPRGLELTDPARHEHEEDRMIAAYREACEQTPTTWPEFVAIFDLAPDGGQLTLDEDKATVLLGHARRLARTA